MGHLSPASFLRQVVGPPRSPEPAFPSPHGGPGCSGWDPERLVVEQALPLGAAASFEQMGTVYPSWVLSEFPRAAVTNYLKLGGLNDRNSLSHSSGAQTSEIDLAGSWDLEWWDGEEQRGIQLCIA